jgi:hypothetical protein
LTEIKAISAKCGMLRTACDRMALRADRGVIDCTIKGRERRTNRRRP